MEIRIRNWHRQFDIFKAIRFQQQESKQCAKGANRFSQRLFICTYVLQYCNVVVFPAFKVFVVLEILRYRFLLAALTPRYRLYIRTAVTRSSDRFLTKFGFKAQYPRILRYSYYSCLYLDIRVRIQSEFYRIRIRAGFLDLGHQWNDTKSMKTKKANEIIQNINSIESFKIFLCQRYRAPNPVFGQTSGRNPDCNYVIK